MADPYFYEYPSPLEGWDRSEPLSEDKHEEGPDAKSLVNPRPQVQSKAYTEFTSGVTNGPRGGFDVHIYYVHTVPYELEFATALHERIRREFPELRIYRLWDRGVGPHPVAMFEVNLHTPQHFGAFVPWLVINRGPLSALVHPNTGDDYRDHTQRATWLGQPYPLQAGVLRDVVQQREQRAKEGKNVVVS